MTPDHDEVQIQRHTFGQACRSAVQGFLAASFARQWMWTALVGGCFSGSVAVLFVVYAYASVAPAGAGRVLLLMPLLLGCALLAPLGAVPLAFVAGVLTKRTTRLTVLAIFCCVMHFPLIAWGMRCGNTIRTEAFEQLAQRSKPLVDAVGAFEQRTGRPPHSLAELIPDHLAEVPKTGLGLYPEYRYMTGADVSADYHGNKWVLLVPCPRGLLNWDTFLYFPNQRYPETGHGLSFERMGEWAYVHE
jgi:hypothetical protein